MAKNSKKQPQDTPAGKFESIEERDTNLLRAMIHFAVINDDVIHEIQAYNALAEKYTCELDYVEFVRTVYKYQNNDITALYKKLKDIVFSRKYVGSHKGELRAQQVLLREFATKYADHITDGVEEKNTAPAQPQIMILGTNPDGTPILWNPNPNPQQ